MSERSELISLQLGLNAAGFKERRLSLVLQVKATEYTTLPKNGPSTGSKPREFAKKPGAGSNSLQDYDPLYIDSSGEEDKMEDIQPSSSLSRPAGAIVLPVASSDNVLIRCFNDLLKLRNEVSQKQCDRAFFSIPVRSPPRMGLQTRMVSYMRGASIT